mmetsp:Transcript_22924/g.78031  ORF Transcript_22924/g.78031 Transcript_22924/m.78031 type:complete len:210 (-) Transcript_22924:3605-4234(-)
MPSAAMSSPSCSAKALMVLAAPNGEDGSSSGTTLHDRSRSHACGTVPATYVTLHTVTAPGGSLPLDGSTVTAPSTLGAAPRSHSNEHPTIPLLFCSRKSLRFTLSSGTSPKLRQSCERFATVTGFSDGRPLKPSHLDLSAFTTAGSASTPLWNPAPRNVTSVASPPSSATLRAHSYTLGSMGWKRMPTSAVPLGGITPFGFSHVITSKP